MGARIPLRRSRAARAARFAGALSLPVLVLTGLGHRFAIVPQEAMLALLILGFGLAAAALILALAALVVIWNSGDEGAGDAFAGIVYAAPALALLGLALFALWVYPRLNDVSTDTDDPPRFQSIDAPVPAAIEPHAAELQHEAYPDVAARLYSLPVERVHDAVREVVGQRGWEVTLDVAPDGPDRAARIEAVARTLLFAFRDAVAIRIAAAEDGTRVDVRSASTMGEHDLGQNARRIQSFLDDLDAALQGELDGAPEEGEEPPQEPPGEAGT